MYIISVINDIDKSPQAYCTSGKSWREGHVNVWLLVAESYNNDTTPSPTSERREERVFWSYVTIRQALLYASIPP